MPFPNHDSFWKDAVGFLMRNYKEGELIIAPDEFAEKFSSVHSYAATFVPSGFVYQWVVIHKGMMEHIKKGFLTDPGAVGKPVFANDVFVIFSCKDKLPRVDAGSPHLAAYNDLLANLKNKPPPPNSTGRLKPKLPLADCSVEEIREEMNLRYSSPDLDQYDGYEHPHLWDDVRDRELDKIIRRMIAPVNQMKILEVGCGMGHSIPMFADCVEYLGTDLSDVAIDKARKLHSDLPWCKFERMDAMNLQLDDSQFDLVAAVEMIEHVNDGVKAIQEAHRVLKPEGRLILSTANRDSLHLRMMRKLGHPEFKFTVEHIREFSYAEMKDILEKTGFKIVDSAGVFMAPYLGIPDVDRPVRHLTDDDPDVVEWFRHLGEAAGPEYGFEFVVLSEKLP